MKLYVAAHYPLSFTQGSRLRIYPIAAEPTETVASFKERMQQVLSVDKSVMSVIYKEQHRSDDQVLCENGEFTPCVAPDRTYIHVRVEDPEMQKEVRRLMAGGLKGLELPLDQVIVEGQ